VAEPLTPEQARQPGYPSEWTIAQVLSHLGSGAEINGLILDAGLAGEEPPAREAYPPIWDRWNSKTPEEQAADAVKADAELVEKVTANVESPATFTIWSGPVDVRGLAAARLSEHALHTWDVAVALDPNATVIPEAVNVIIDLIGRVAEYSAKPSTWRGLVHVTTIGPGREFALNVGESTTLEPWATSEAAGQQSADATLTMPAEALVRLVYGRLDAGHTPDRISASGITLDDLRSIFRGF